MIMRKLLAPCALLLLWLAGALPALAQGGFGNTTGYVVTNCGATSPAAAFVPGKPGPFTVDANGNLCGAIALVAPTTGGCTPAKTLSAASTNATNVKAAAGTLCSLVVINTTATLYYLKFYNKATAPTCNSDTVIQSIPIPASATGAGVAVDVGPYGWAFPAGIGFCLTGALADNDNTSAATGVAISYSYK